MIRSIYRDSQGQTTETLTAEGWANALKDPAGLLWVDIVAEPADQVQALLTQTFALHPAIVRRLVQTGSPPRGNDLGSHIYTVVHSLVIGPSMVVGDVAFDPQTQQLTTYALDLILGKNFLVTYHQSAQVPSDGIWAQLHEAPDALASGAACLFYRVIEILISGYLAVLSCLGDTIETMENSVLSQHLAAEQQATIAIRRALLELGRILRPQAEALDKLAREGRAEDYEEARGYLREAYSDMAHASELVSTLRDRMDGVINVNLAVASNRVNEIVKVLTLFTVLFLPITFLTGFFGMNFPFLPVQQPVLFVGTLALMVVCPVGMWLWFWRRGWL